MEETLNAHQLIQLAQCLTRMQSALTDYELGHFAELDAGQKNQIEKSLSLLAAAAGRIYAYSVQLVYRDAETRLQELQQATDGLKKFLRTTREIQQVLDIVSSIAGMADAIITHDIEGIAVETDQIIQMVGNT
jgi:phage host-nuclease inhibitor protein Gam